MIKKIISYFTLQWVENKFTDSVSGKTVALYKDKYGQEFHKDGRWSFFAVQVFRGTWTGESTCTQEAIDNAAKNIAIDIDRQIMEAIKRHHQS